MLGRAAHSTGIGEAFDRAAQRLRRGIVAAIIEERVHGGGAGLRNAGDGVGIGDMRLEQQLGVVIGLRRPCHQRGIATPLTVMSEVSPVTELAST